VTELDRLARSLPDACDILDRLTKRNVKLTPRRSIHDRTDLVGRLIERPGSTCDQSLVVAEDRKVWAAGVDLVPLPTEKLTCCCRVRRWWRLSPALRARPGLVPYGERPGSGP
jgi:hypothetical protein